MGAEVVLQFATRHGRSRFGCRSQAVAHGKKGGLWTYFKTIVVASIVGCRLGKHGLCSQPMQ
eukprot:9581034-Karenia_brevis.AAC.1